MPTSTTTSRHTLTRADVAARLGVSTSTVRRMEFLHLHPVQDQAGVHLFDPAEVEQMPPRMAREKREPESPEARDARRLRRREGRLAARLFGMFERGVPLPQIVITTREPPELVRRAFSEWRTSLEQGEWEREERARRGGADY